MFAILNPEGLLRDNFEPHREDGFAVEKFCVLVDVDAMDYDPLEQIDVNHSVRYFTFYSLDFSLLQTLYQYFQGLS